MRHNKNRDRQEDVSDIFRDLWGFKFIEKISFSRIKNEMWPKILIVIDRDDEKNKKMIRDLLQNKYEFPFSNLKIVSSENKKELDPKEKSEPSVKSEASGNKPKIIFKVSGRGKLPPFKAS